MGHAIVDGWRTAGIDLSQVVVIRPSGKPVEGARVVSQKEQFGVGRETKMSRVKAAMAGRLRRGRGDRISTEV